jgi:hypothetical protein
MSLISSWVFFPLVLVAIGLGWGALVQWAAGEPDLGPLTIPIGLATALVIAGLITAFSPIASLAAPFTAVFAIAGIAYVWGRAKLGSAPALAAVGVLLVYGAPVILSGQATFLGYTRLDDTATWFALIDQLFTHGRSFGALPPSTFKLLVEANLGTGTNNGIVGSSYPAGAFLLPGVGHWVTGIDIAWIFQPYLATCAAALSLTIYALLAPLLEWRWLRAFVAFIAAQSALLYGYAAWGGIKELTAAFLLGLGVALVADLVAREKPEPRNVIPLTFAGAALMITLGPGSVIYVLPAFLAVLAVLVWRAAMGADLVRLVWVVASLFTATALLAIPLWLTLVHYLHVDQASYTSIDNTAAELGNLVRPLRAVQIAGIYLFSDFRNYSAADPAGATPSFVNYLLIWLVFASGALALCWTVWRRRIDLLLYVAVALIGALALYFGGSTPWLIGKALAISSPALLLAGLVGGALLFGNDRVVSLVGGVIVLAAIAGGVLWSNWLQYRNVTLAPRARLEELATIGTKLKGHAPTFFNEYEIYGDRHFLRAGAPVEPAEYRTVFLPTVTGAVLTKAAWADLDSFPATTLDAYKSIVIRNSPVESRPPSNYHLAWSGRYYQLWQQAKHPTERIIKHVPLGDSNTYDYCGDAEGGRPFGDLCSIQPAAVPACPTLTALGRTAQQDGGTLLAYERANPIVLRGTDTRWPGTWNSDAAAEGSITPTTPGTAYAHVSIPTGPHRYQLWLGGSFTRGFVVSVDGHRIGSISDQQNPFGAGYNEVGSPLVLKAGVHTIALTFPEPTLAPGGDDDEDYTSLSEIALAPLDSRPKLLSLKPAQARELCGRSLDWIEIVAPAK